MSKAQKQKAQNERYENEFLKEILTEAAYNELMDAWNREREAKNHAEKI